MVGIISNSHMTKEYFTFSIAPRTSVNVTFEPRECIYLPDSCCPTCLDPVEARNRNRLHLIQECYLPGVWFHSVLNVEPRVILTVSARKKTSGARQNSACHFGLTGLVVCQYANPPPSSYCTLPHQ